MDLSKLIPPKKTTEEAYKAGYDCGKNGANRNNCDISYFSSSEMTKEWERGNKEGAKAKSS